MGNQKGDTNWGCLIMVAIFVIINFVFLFSPENKESISEVGGMLIFLAFIAGLIYFLSKINNNSSEKESKDKAMSVTNTPDNTGGNTNHKANSESNNNGCGCIIGVVGVIIALAALSFLLNNSEITSFVGTLFAIVLIIGIGIYMYNSGKD